MLIRSSFFLCLSLSPSPSLFLSLISFTSSSFPSLLLSSFSLLLPPLSCPFLPPSHLLCVCVCVCVCVHACLSLTHTHTALCPACPLILKEKMTMNMPQGRGSILTCCQIFFLMSTLHLYSVMVTATHFLNCLHVWLLVWILLGDLIWIFNVKALSIRSLTFCLTLITRRIMRGLFSGKRTVTALTEMMGNK